jgi:ribonuclease T2
MEWEMLNPKAGLAALVAALAVAGAPVAAAAQDFDYYLLALTWTPSWCLAEGDARSEQCDPDRDLGFTLHGLWPQYEDGWPEDCEALVPDPSRRQTAAMADIMGSGGLAWYEWKKHGRCTGLTADRYFAQSRTAYEALSLPRPTGGTATAELLEAVFLAANPGLAPDDVIVTCKGGRVAEVRICLTPDLSPRSCAPDVLDDACRNRGTLEIPPIP